MERKPRCVETLMEEFICMAQRMNLTESIAVISFMYIQHLYQI